MKYQLSILIPARNEIFLKNTVEDLLKNKNPETEIIIGLDGEWAMPQIEDHPDVTIIHTGVSIGQRAMTNRCASLSQAHFLMKVDAHCAFDKDFDIKMMEKMEDNFTMIPLMKNLHVFDWVCSEGHRRYQGPTGVCKVCGKETTREFVWVAKNNPTSFSYCFDSEPHFQYAKSWRDSPVFKEQHPTGLTDTMSIQGSAFMCTREKYWELKLSEEEFGSWGNQGIEVACKTWLSGGRVVCNHNTYYGHLFRTQGGDFGFPYKQNESEIQSCKKKVWQHFFNGEFKQQIHPMSWLIRKFMPVSDWTEEKIDKLKN
jgi:hypothetical protein